MLKRLITFIIATVLVLSTVTLALPQTAYAQTTDGNTEETSGSEVYCGSGEGDLGSSLGWILCPIIHLIVTATQFIQDNIIVPFLSVSPLTTEDDNAVYTLWQSIRNIANILFIIVFFIVIFSQATSIGISNYGIKRLLPRLALVAIGANLSYFIVAIAIDAFNIFGAGISDLVMAAIPQNPTNAAPGNEVGADNIFALVTGLGVLFATPAGGAVMKWLGSIIGIAFLILLVAVIVLVLRQMIIILLVVVSPLAFVAYLLPNTEKYFEKWRGLLMQLLMMYPLIVLLFATGKIVSALITSGNFTLASGDTSQATADAIKTVMGFFAMTIPLVALPATFAAANSLIGRLSSAIRQRTDSMSGAATGAIGERLSPHARNLRNRIAQSSGGGIFGKAARFKAKQGILRKAKRASRERELERSGEDIVAAHARKSESFRKSAGLGKDGAGRVLSRAIATQEKRQLEEIEDSMSLLRRTLKENNIDAKTFAGGNLANYIKRGETEKEMKDRGYSYSQIFSQNPSLFNAALNSAASQGEIGTIMAARAGTQLINGQKIDQKDVDLVSRINDGKLKEKGGYPFATNYKIAAGRSALSNSVAPDAQLIERVNVAQKAYDAVKDSTDTNAIERAEERLNDAKQNLNTSSASSDQEMMIHLLEGMAQTGSKSIAGMKAGVLFQSAKNLSPQVMDNLNRSMDINNPDGETYLQALQKRMDEIMKNPNTRDSSEASGAINDMNEILKRKLNITDTPTPTGAGGGTGAGGQPQPVTINLNNQGSGGSTAGGGEIPINQIVNEGGQPVYSDNNPNNPVITTNDQGTVNINLNSQGQRIPNNQQQTGNQQTIPQVETQQQTTKSGLVEEQPIILGSNEQPINKETGQKVETQLTDENGNPLSYRKETPTFGGNNREKISYDENGPVDKE